MLIQLGSSPRVRGTPLLIPLPPLRRRFIPACAGNTDCSRRRNARRSVHPRVCGEHVQQSGRRSHEAGSSPRVRGTHPLAQPGPADRRFIPACAGNTPAHSSSPSESPVHPRVCGEHGRGRAQAGDGPGSSPRVRGTLVRRAAGPVARRFIPACAGNTFCTPRSSLSGAVHPRVCGEHRWRASSSTGSSGSSPRVRGTLIGVEVHSRPRRFIPACAGNTLLPLLRADQTAVHPRVCGEHRGPPANQTEDDGSSPRVRGTLGLLPQLRRLDRFIPACAGNTYR